MSEIRNRLMARKGKRIVKRIRSSVLPYRELMSYYNCALMRIETKFKVLNEDFSVRYDHNPIQAIKTRIKSPESIAEKLNRNGWPISIESIERNLNDVAGIRVICPYQKDVFMLADALLKQDDIKLIARKDYISQPKENGYRSLHLIIETPIFLHDEKRKVKVEIQFRTMAQDWWASLEHEIHYKKEYAFSSQIRAELLQCAELANNLDRNMERIYALTEAQVFSE